METHLNSSSFSSINWSSYTTVQFSLDTHAQTHMHTCAHTCMAIFIVFHFKWQIWGIFQLPSSVNSGRNKQRHFLPLPILSKIIDFLCRDIRTACSLNFLTSFRWPRTTTCVLFSLNIRVQLMFSVPDAPCPSPCSGICRLALQAYLKVNA